MRAGFAILEPRFVDVVSHPVPHVTLSLPMLNFAPRTNTAIPLRLIDECARRYWFGELAPRGTYRMLPQKIDLSPGHFLDILSGGVAAIDHHLF